MFCLFFFQNLLHEIWYENHVKMEPEAVLLHHLWKMSMSQRSRGSLGRGGRRRIRHRRRWVIWKFFYELGWQYILKVSWKKAKNNKRKEKDDAMLVKGKKKEAREEPGQGRRHWRGIRRQFALRNACVIFSKHFGRRTGENVLWCYGGRQEQSWRDEKRNGDEEDRRFLCTLLLPSNSLKKVKEKKNRQRWRRRKRRSSVQVLPGSKYPGKKKTIKKKRTRLRRIRQCGWKGFVIGCYARGPRRKKRKTKF